MSNDKIDSKVEISVSSYIRNSSVFTHVKNQPIVCDFPRVESGPYVVDDSSFIPMSEAIKQLGRINDPTGAQLADVYDFPNGHDNGKQLPITRRRDFHDIAEYSQEIRDSAQRINDEVLKAQVEAAEKAKFAKELDSVRASSSSSSSELK